MERILMRLEVLMQETLGELNKRFRQKVQLEEQLEENEVQIHFKRGYMQAFEDFQKVIKGIAEADKLEALKEQRRLKLADNSAGKVEKIPEEKVIL